MRMRTRTKFILSIAIILIILISVGALYYFSGQKKTPEHSINLISTAIKQHDLATFEKHFDTEAFYSQAFDDVIAPTLRQPTDDGINDFLAGIMATVKQTFVSSMVDQTKRYVESGSLENQNNGAEQILAKKFTELTDFRNSTFKSVRTTKIEGNIAYVNLLIHQNQIDEDFDLQIKMRKLQDESWSIVSINNIREFLAEASKKKTEKLAVLNKPLSKKIQEQVAISSDKFEHKQNNRYGTSYAFSYTPTIEFKASKQVAEFTGQVEVFNKNKDKVFTQRFISAGPFPLNTKQEFHFSWSLNPFVFSEKELINTSDSDLTVKAEIIRVNFVDGSELHLLENIPGTTK